MIKRRWSKSEEKEFTSLLTQETQYPNWETISKKLKSKKISKTARQCYKKWHHNKNKKKYKINFPNPSFTKEEEKKLLKLSFSLAPSWEKIALFFKNKKPLEIQNHFYCLIRKSLVKGCKIIGRKNSYEILFKVKPRLYSILIKQDIKVFFTEFKESAFGKKDADCPDFIFIFFFDFVWKLYFWDFEEIWEKISEREVFLIKKVIVYIIDNNFKYNREFVMKQEKKDKFLKNFKFFLDYRNDVVKSYTESFYNKNINIIELPEEKEKREQELKIIEQRKKCFFLNFENQKKNKNLKQIFVLDNNPLLFYKSKNKFFFEIKENNIASRKNHKICRNFKITLFSAKNIE